MPKKTPHPPAARPGYTNSSSKRQPQTTANIGSFLQAQTTRTEDLLHPHIDATLLPQIQKIADFISHHRLATSVHDGSSPSRVLQAPAYYAAAVADFSQTQWSRQSAGLRTNVNKESTNTGLTQLVQAHSLALKAAMMNNSRGGVDDLLTAHEMCRLHSILLGEAAARRGVYRTTHVRAGRTHFGPPHEVQAEVELLFCAVERYRYRNEWFISDTSSAQHAYHCLALTALIMLGICKIHPFLDGNGRLARIYANGILSGLLGLPFPVTFTATPQHRQEYIDALQHGDRQAWALTTAAATATQNQNNSSTGTITVLGPLVHMIVDRILHAINQLESSLSDHAHAALNDQEALMARRVRERAAKGQCTICLDDRPNIATLCCGQAVHLHCLAEWLSNHATCVACRAPLPQLPARAARSTAVDDADNDDERYSTTEEDETDYDDEDTETTIEAETAMDQMVQSASSPADIFLQQAQNGEQHPYIQCISCSSSPTIIGCDNDMCATCCLFCDQHCSLHDGYGGTSSSEEESQEEPNYCCGSGCYNKAADDCENNRCGRCCRQATGLRYCARHATAPPPEEENTTTEECTTEDCAEENATPDASTTEDTDPPQQPPTCVHCCRNRSAVTCSNGMCGPCCVVTGRFYAYCERHHH